MTMPNGNGLKDIQKKRDAWKTLQLYNPSLKVFGDDVFTGDGEIKPEVWEAYSNLKGDAMNVPAIQAAMRGEPAQQPAAAGPPPTPQVLPEDVPQVQSYFDPKVWSERAQRIGRGLGSAFGTAAQAAGISPPPMPQRGDAGWKAPPTISGRVTAAGRAFAEAPPEATAVQRFLAPLTELEPELGALEAFQEITDPVRGHLYTRENVYGLFEQEVKQRYDILRERGVDHISALAAASRQAEQAGEIGGFKSFLINMLTDPVELTPSVGITAGLGKAGLRQIAKMGATTPLKVPKGAAAAIARQQAGPSLLRAAKAAPEPRPVGRKPIEIGDDVVFPGPDGDISGKVTGKGVTEIEGISKPHLTVRYETPSGIKEEFVSEGMARSLTPTQAADVDTVFHGTRGGRIESFIDSDGNLVLQPSPNFEGRTVGVSFTRDRATAKDYATRFSAGEGGGAIAARRQRGGFIFEIDRDAIPDKLFVESAEEMATRGTKPVVIPEGRFKASPVDEGAQSALQIFETQGRAGVRALSDRELGERSLRSDIEGELAEARAGGEYSGWFPYKGRELTQEQLDIADRFGFEAVDNPLGPFIGPEIARRMAGKSPDELTALFKGLAKGADDLSPADRNAPFFYGPDFETHFRKTYGAGVPVPTTARAADVPEGVLPTDVTQAVGGAPAVQEAVRKAYTFREVDEPGFFSRFLDLIPGIKQTQRYIRPGAAETPVNIQTSYVASRSEEALFSAKTISPRQQIFDEADRLFGPGAVDDVKTNVRFIGTANESRTIDGTLFDVAQRPHLYDLSAEQRAFLTNVWQPHNSKFMKELIESYGANLREYPAPPGGVFLSNVDIADDVLEALGTSESGAAMIGRGKARSFKTAADRMAYVPRAGRVLPLDAKDKVGSKFKPLTNIRKLQTSMDDWKARIAGKEVFKQGSGGLTRVQAVDLKHPNLRKSKDDLARRIRNLRARINTAVTQERGLTAGARQAGTQAKQAERRAQPMLKSMEELDANNPEFGAEFAFLSGKANELLRVAAQAETRGLNLGLRAGARRGKAETMATEMSQLMPMLWKLRQQYAAANLPGLQLVQKSLFRYYPSAEAKAVKELQSISTSSLVRIADEWRGTAFAGDLSPIAGIQMPIGFLFNSKLGIQRLVGAGRATARSKDLMHVFRTRTLADDVASDPVGWQEFAFWSGIPIRSGTPREFSGGLLRFIPGFTRGNEAMYRLVMRQSKALYDKQISILAKQGVTGDSAKLAAADISTMVYPIWSPARIGLSPARAAALRALPISVSFITRPAAFMAKASTGFVKLPAGLPLTPTEKLAVRLAVVVAATTMSMSISSSVISALARGRDPWDATLDVIDPRSAKFAAVVIGSRYIPLGGPFRSMIKMIVPREVDWAPFPVPFANVGNFVKNRINPALKTQLELIANKDFYGNKIHKGSMPEAVLRSLLYEIEGLAPLTFGTAIGGARRGLPGEEIAEESAAQFMGSNIGIESPGEQKAAVGAELARAALPEGVGGTYKEIADSEGYTFPTTGPLAISPSELAESPREYWQFSRGMRNKIEADPRFADLSRRTREATKRYNPRLAEYYEGQDMEWERVFGEKGELARLATLSESKDSEHPMAWYRLRAKIILRDFYRDRERDRESAERRDLFREQDPDGPFRKAEDIYVRLLFVDDEELVKALFPDREYMPLEDELLGFNWDEYQDRKKYLEDTYGAKLVSDMKESSRAKLPEVELQRRKDSDYIAGTGYWDVDKTLASQYGVSAELEEYKRLDRTKKPEARKYLAEHEVLRKGVKNKERDAKRMMRLRNPELDEVLVRYGYVPARAQRTGQDFWGGVRFQ